MSKATVYGEEREPFKVEQVNTLTSIVPCNEFPYTTFECNGGVI